jgi:hypothetical protein
MVPLNVSTWSAHVPADAPAAVLTLVQRLMSDSRE